MLTNTELTAHEKGALSLVLAYFNREAASPRTKAYAVAAGRFDAMCVMLDRLGLVQSPVAVHLDLADLVHVAGPRPAATGMNTATRDYDVALARQLAATFRS